MGRMVVFTNPKEGRVAEYNKWYQEIHIPEVLAAGPFTSAQRYKFTDAQMIPDQEHTYAAVYEFKGSAEDAIAALKAAAPGFDMSESGGPGSRMVFLEEAGPRVDA